MNKRLLAKWVWGVAVVSIPAVIALLRASADPSVAVNPPRGAASAVHPASIVPYSPVVVELGKGQDLHFAPPAAEIEPALKPEPPLVFRESAISARGGATRQARVEGAPASPPEPHAIPSPAAR